MTVSGRLAVVLGIEADRVFGSAVDPGLTPADFAAAIEAYHRTGVRRVRPSHFADNAFRGAEFTLGTAGSSRAPTRSAPLPAYRYEPAAGPLRVRPVRRGHRIACAGSRTWDTCCWTSSWPASCSARPQMRIAGRGRGWRGPPRDPRRGRDRRATALPRWQGRLGGIARNLVWLRDVVPPPGIRPSGTLPRACPRRPWTARGLSERTYDIAGDGVAHTGTPPDLVADLRAARTTDADTAPLPGS